ncbi:MAG: hypothetical protein GOVbin1230_14 [Prokaryotic dsDNA virus sp.]|nr:MAG: hypothetical protein GOVbin1230_14 [Prokaryotic dsDNA virus sp.]|tara:strand:+ start:851 stop:1003 length:153 start_codon:yes stop_codon:yes gene_type:complete
MSKFKRHKTKNGRIRFIVNQEKIAGNHYKWIYKASDKDVDELYDYWTQEL